MKNEIAMKQTEKEDHKRMAYNTNDYYNTMLYCALYYLWAGARLCWYVSICFLYKWKIFLYSHSLVFINTSICV